MTNNNLPEFYQVKIGKNVYEIETDTLVASMAHQFISKSTNLENLYNYDVIYQMSKEEIEEFLSENKDENNFIDLFGDWIENFRLYHGKKNEPICRDLIFSFSNNAKYSIKILDLISLKYENGIEFIDYEDPLLTNDQELLDFINTLSWNDVKDLAEELQKPQPEPNYEDEWAECEKELVKWDDSFGILDFIENYDIVELEEVPDDQPA